MRLSSEEPKKSVLKLVLSSHPGMRLRVRRVYPTSSRLSATEPTRPREFFRFRIPGWSNLPSPNPRGYMVNGSDAKVVEQVVSCAYLAGKELEQREKKKQTNRERSTRFVDETRRRRSRSHGELRFGGSSSPHVRPDGKVVYVTVQKNRPDSERVTRGQFRQLTQRALRCRNNWQIIKCSIRLLILSGSVHTCFAPVCQGFPPARRLTVRVGTETTRLVVVDDDDAVGDASSRTTMPGHAQFDERVMRVKCLTRSLSQ